jgi:hypothetical protein
VDTRFQLPAEQVDMVIAAGHDALRGNRIFNDFLASIGGRKGPRPSAPPKPESTPVAQVPATTTGQKTATR